MVIATGEILVMMIAIRSPRRSWHAAEKYRFNCIDGWTVCRDGHYHRIAGEKGSGF